MPKEKDSHKEKDEKKEPSIFKQEAENESQENEGQDDDISRLRSAFARYETRSKQSSSKKKNKKKGKEDVDAETEDEDDEVAVFSLTKALEKEHKKELEAYEKLSGRRKFKKFIIFLGDLFLDAVIVAVAVIFIRTLIVSPFRVEGHSMDNSFSDGDFILVDQISYRFANPKYGDVVVFRPPTEDNMVEQTGLICEAKKRYAAIVQELLGEEIRNICLVSEYFVKRIIGVPGDTIEIKRGKVYVKHQFSDIFEEVEEDYLSERNKNRTCLSQSSFCATLADTEGKTFIVPEDTYFVLGDNRTGSNDSRFWREDENNSPYVPIENIRGKVQVIIWPFDNLEVVKNIEQGKIEENLSK